MYRPWQSNIVNGSSYIHGLCRACKNTSCTVSVSGLLQRYTNHDIVKYLESIGAEFGACQNAYTSADDTVYEFLVPTDEADVLENSFAVFAEFATKIRYTYQH